MLWRRCTCTLWKHERETTYMVRRSLSEVNEIKTEIVALKEEITAALCCCGKKGKEGKVKEESEQGRGISLGLK